MPVIRKEKEIPRTTSLRSAVDELLDDAWWGPLRFPVIREWRTIFPKVDVSETADSIKVAASVPGVDPDKIEVTVSDNSLRLSGSIESEKEEKGKRFYRFERECGEFSRSIVLPARVNADKVSAQAKDGVLTVTLPKIESTDREKRISVKKA